MTRGLEGEVVDLAPIPPEVVRELYVVMILE